MYMYIHSERGGRVTSTKGIIERVQKVQGMYYAIYVSVSQHHISLSLSQTCVCVCVCACNDGYVIGKGESDGRFPILRRLLCRNNQGGKRNEEKEVVVVVPQRQEFMMGTSEFFA